ncbi:hypothetical protein BHE74_00050471, partial [Ensete ventricosum]
PPLPGGTISLWLFPPVTMRNRPMTVDFDHCRLLLRFVVGRYQSREGEEEGEEKPGALFARAICCRRAISSLAGDFFSLHEEKKRLLV